MRADPPSGLTLSRLVRVSISRPGLTIALGLALAAAGFFYTARALTFQTSALQLLPPQRLYVQRFKDYLADFGELNDIVVVVEAPTVEGAEDYADRLAAQIKALPRARRVSHRIDPDLFAGQALLYLSMDRLTELRDKITEHRKFIEEYAARPTLAGLLDGLGNEIARRFASSFIDLGLDEDTPKTLDVGFIDRLLGHVGSSLDGNATAGSPWARVFTSAGDDERAGYFLSGDKKLLFILVEPRREAGNFADNQEFVAAIRRTIGALHREYPDVAAGVTGTAALSDDEMLTAFHDSTVATALAFVLTLGLLLFVFRRVVEPVAMLAVLVMSLGWSLGLITATVGHLTVFSVMFISLLVGIGIDYGIYVFFRYEEELGLGLTPARALDVAARRTGPGILFGALSAAGTFGVLMLTEFRGIQEFGFIAGVSILMALLAMLTVFPAVLLTIRRRALARVQASPAATSSGDDIAVLPKLLRHSTPILAVTVALSAGSLVALPGVRFDYNRLNLQARGTESVTWERRIMESGRSGFAALATADSLPELRRKQAAFESLPAVSDVRSVLTLIPKDQDPKITVLHEIAPLVARVEFSPDSTVDPRAVRGALETLRDRLELGIREADPGTTVETLRSAHARAVALLAHLDRDAGGDLTRRLAPIQASLRDDFVAKLHRLQDNVAPRPLTIDELPEEVARKFVGRSGRYLMQIYPGIDMWDHDGAREFVSQLRSADAAVTGSPVISYEASRLMEAAYFHGTLYAIVLVTAFTLVVLRNARDTLLALTPLVVGTLWTVGMMRVVGLPFNLANVWALPLIVGAAAEYGLNVTLRYREGSAAGRAALPASVVMAVLLNGLTNVSGFGSLMVARHQGMFGLGLLLTVGAAAGLVSSLGVLPVLLRLMDSTNQCREPAAGHARTTS